MDSKKGQVQLGLLLLATRTLVQLKSRGSCCIAWIAIIVRSTDSTQKKNALRPNCQAQHEMILRKWNEIDISLLYRLPFAVYAGQFWKMKTQLIWFLLVSMRESSFLVWDQHFFKTVWTLCVEEVATQTYPSPVFHAAWVCTREIVCYPAAFCATRHGCISRWWRRDWRCLLRFQ